MRCPCLLEQILVALLVGGMLLETGDLVIEYFILSPVCNAHTPTATRSRFLFKIGTEKENISRCVMRGREGYGITEVGWGGRREGIQLSSAGWGRAFECYSYFHSTDFARQSLVRHRSCIHSRIIRGEVRTAATLSDPAPTRPWGSQIWSIQPLMAKSRLARVITFEMDDENVNESLTS